MSSHQRKILHPLLKIPVQFRLHIPVRPPLLNHQTCHHYIIQVIQLLYPDQFLHQAQLQGHLQLHLNMPVQFYHFIQVVPHQVNHWYLLLVFFIGANRKTQLSSFIKIKIKPICSYIWRSQDNYVLPSQWDPIKWNKKLSNVISFREANLKTSLSSFIKPKFNSVCSPIIRS